MMCIPSPGISPLIKCPESWKAASSDAQDDVAEQGKFRVAEGGTVDRADHGHFDVQQIHQQALAFPVGLIPVAWRPPGRDARVRGVR